MKKVIYQITIAILFFSINISIAWTHPGGTDSKGCHTCYTDCEKWGLRYGEYHCHSGGTGRSSSSSSSSYTSSSIQDTYFFHKPETLISTRDIVVKKRGRIYFWYDENMIPHYANFLPLSLIKKIGKNHNVSIQE